MLLSSAFCPPISYFALLARDFTLSPDRVFPSEACIDRAEHYEKQTYRNRCLILSASGVEAIGVPVVHEGNIYSKAMGEIRVDYSTPWRRRLTRTLDTAYRTAAFYDEYRDGILAVIDEGIDRLFDLNMSLLELFLRLTGVSCALTVSDRFVPYGSVPDDYRRAIHPKHPDTVLRDMGLEKAYFQVFSGKYAFTPHLSVMDLLFNEGPDSVLYIKKLG